MQKTAIIKHKEGIRERCRRTVRASTQFHSLVLLKTCCAVLPLRPEVMFATFGAVAYDAVHSKAKQSTFLNCFHQAKVFLQPAFSKSYHISTSIYKMVRTLANLGELV